VSKRNGKLGKEQGISLAQRGGLDSQEEGGNLEAKAWLRGRKTDRSRLNKTNK